MRKLKKFKRYDEGGAVGSGSGDPFSYTEFEPGRGEKNLEGIKNFFGFGKKEPAPIEERKPPKVREEAEPTRAEPVKAEPTKAESKPIKLTKAEERADYEGDTDATSGSQTFKPSARPPVASTSRPAASRPAVEKTPTAPAKPPKAAEKTPEPSSKPSYSGAGDSDDSVDTKKKNEVERLKRVGSGAVEQTMMGPVETVALGVSKLPALARAGFGAARKAYNDLTSPSGGKGTGKFPEEKPEISVPRTPAVERKAKVEGPPASAAAPKPKTSAEQMGLRETGPMERARKAKEKFDEAAETARKAKPAADDEVVQEAAKRAASKRQTPDNRRFPNKGSATTGRPKASGEFKPTGNKFDRPVGEKRGPKTDEVLKREGLAAKKGGKIPAFKKGGFVSRGDGCAQRGKTKGRMV